MLDTTERSKLIRDKPSQRLGPYCSEIVIFAIGENLVLSLDDLLLHLLELVLWDDDLSGGEDGGLDEGQVSVIDHSTEEPDEGLLKLIIALGGDVVVLQVLLAVEGDLLSLDLSVTHVDLVTDEDDGDAFANTGEIFVPLGHVGVSDTGAHIEHDDTTVAADVVTITESSKFLLTGSIPDVEDNISMGGVERHGVDLDTEGGDVALLEFTSQVTLDEGSLADATVTDEDELELGGSLLLLLVNHFSVISLKERKEEGLAFIVAFDSGLRMRLLIGRAPQVTQIQSKSPIKFSSICGCNTQHIDIF